MLGEAPGPRDTPQKPTFWGQPRASCLLTTCRAVKGLPLLPLDGFLAGGASAESCFNSPDRLAFCFPALFRALGTRLWLSGAWGTSSGRAPCLNSLTSCPPSPQGLAHGGIWQSPELFQPRNSPICRRLGRFLATFLPAPSRFSPRSASLPAPPGAAEPSKLILT